MRGLCMGGTSRVEDCIAVVLCGSANGGKLKLYVVSKRIVVLIMTTGMLLVLVSKLVCTLTPFKVGSSTSQYSSVHTTTRRTVFTTSSSICSKQSEKQRMVTTLTKFNHNIRAADSSHITSARWMG